MNRSFKKPLVTAVVPTKNSATTLRACLEKLANQSYANLEIIVVDNFSEDDTQKIAKEFTKQVYKRGPERCAQRNFGAQKGKGEFLVFIDSDMELSKHVIREAVVAHLQSQCAVVIPEESFGEGFWAECKRLERQFYIGIEWIEAARFFSREEFEAVGGYDEELVSGEDWDLSQRILVNSQASRTEAYILHNEGRLSLFATLKKKYYYASKVMEYVAKKHTSSSKQISVIRRYGLFLSRPKLLFRQPLLGVGMLFMKSTEYVAGLFGVIRHYLIS